MLRMVCLQEVSCIIIRERFGRSAGALDSGSLIRLHVLSAYKIIFSIQLLVVKSKGSLGSGTNVGNFLLLIALVLNFDKIPHMMFLYGYYARVTSCISHFGIFLLLKRPYTLKIQMSDRSAVPFFSLINFNIGVLSIFGQMIGRRRLHELN